MRPVDDLPYIEFENAAGAVERIYADAWESEDFTAASEVSENAVESGAKIADHITLSPTEFRCRLLFSNSPIRGDLDPEAPGRVRAVSIEVPTYPNLTPLLSVGGITQAVGAGIDSLANAVGLGTAPGLQDRATVLTFEAPPNRPSRMLQKLLELRAAKKLVTVGGSLLRIENMWPSEIHVGRTKDDGDSAGIDLTLQQLEFADTESAEAIPLPLEPRGQKKKSAGNGQGTEMPEGPQKSAMAALVDAAAALVDAARGR
jgi:hypothetical protein